MSRSSIGHKGGAQTDRPFVRLRTNQQGIASIFITLVIMVIVSLIVLGFASLSRRERTQTLDQQLSTQAFYAAESGINDAAEIITAKLKIDPTANLAKTTCANTGNFIGLTPNIDTTNKVSYTCVLVNDAPGSLVYDAVDDNPVAIPLNAVSTMSTVTITWRPTANPTGSPAAQCPSGSLNGKFSPSGSWTCGYGVLRADLVNPAAGSRNGLQDSQLTSFFVPGPGSGGSIAYAGNRKATIVRADCSLGSYTECKATFTGVNMQNAYLRVSSLYQTSKLTISAASSAGAPVQFKDAQIVIDATGKASEVTRRVQVRIPVTPAGTVPGKAIQTNLSLCKRYQVAPNYFAIDTAITDPDPDDPLCQTSPPVSSGSINTAICTRSGGNLVFNGNFSVSAGPGPLISPTAGFTSELPNRGPGVYPDDAGVYGTTTGYTGGFSIQNGPVSYSDGASFIQGFPFPGDPSLGVPASNTYFYSNPNQKVTDPPGTASNFTGVLWKQVITGLLPNSTYNFSGYFDNLLSPNNPTAVDPIVQLTVDGVATQPRQTLLKKDFSDPDQWQRVSMVITTGPGQTTATLEIHDYAENINGDDFGMTLVGLYKCQ